MHAIGGVGPLHVAPVPVPAVHVEITDATVGLGPFTVPPISIPSLPIASITGSVDLAANTISPIRALDPLAGSIGLFSSRSASVTHLSPLMRSKLLPVSCS